MAKKTGRRDFIFKTMKSMATLGGTLAAARRGSATASQPQDGVPSYEEYLRTSAVNKEVLRRFLEEDTWAQFDGELGYILGNSMPRDGIDGSSTLSTVLPSGVRTPHIYRGRPCRINTYGDSFTQCHQVSDGETWQEYLAAHLGEPIRNFGMGGFGLYQAYRRMLREEKTENSAEYLILYMWGDDYFRSVLRCRYILYHTIWDNAGGDMFHGNFWSNIEMDLQAGKLVEKDSLLATPAALYKMTDGDFMVESLKDDLMAQLNLLERGAIRDVDESALRRLSEILDVPPIDFSKLGESTSSVTELRNAYGFAATKTILDKAKTFAKEHGKKLMVVHFGPYDAMETLIESGTRYDQEIVDHLRKNDFLYFDMNEVHVEDFKNFNIPLEDYRKRYFIGHYSPAGNHFFAFSIKDEIVPWLDPPPITYQQDKRRMVDFRGYLPS